MRTFKLVVVFLFFAMFAVDGYGFEAKLVRLSELTKRDIVNARIDVRLGEVLPTDKCTWKVPIVNDTSDDFEVVHIEVSCRCTKAQLKSTRLPVGKKEFLSFTIARKPDNAGPFLHNMSLTVARDNALPIKITFQFKGSWSGPFEPMVSEIEVDAESREIRMPLLVGDTFDRQQFSLETVGDLMDSWELSAVAENRAVLTIRPKQLLERSRVPVVLVSRFPNSDPDRFVKTLYLDLEEEREDATLFVIPRRLHVGRSKMQSTSIKILSSEVGSLSSVVIRQGERVVKPERFEHVANAYWIAWFPPLEEGWEKGFATVVAIFDSAKKTTCEIEFLE